MADSIPPFDLYATLRVAPDAPVEVIVAAHRVLIRRQHPDVSDGLGATEATKRLNVARDWLADPGRRALYDRARAGAPPSPQLRPRTTDSRSPEREAGRRPPPYAMELYFFVARCNRLSRREISALVLAYRRAAVQEPAFASAANEVVRLAQALGRGQVAIEAVNDACADLQATDRRPGGPLLQGLRWTAFAYAVADIGPLVAEVVLAPWREVTEASDAAFERRRRRGERVRVIRARLAIAVALSFVMLLVLAGVLRIVSVALNLHGP